jgi:DNA-binding NarL/FixJ family response regulator
MQETALEGKVQDGLATEGQADPDVTGLVRQLLECVGEDSTLDSVAVESTNTQEILLDVHVDGMRYTLTRSRPPPDQAQVNLSPRETEIVRLVAKGLPNKAIAAVLEISSWTVATHLRRVFAKLAVGSRAEMVARVLQEGLLESNE